MPIPVDCANCGRRMMVREDAVGKKARCPKCGTVFPVPEPILEGEIVEDYGGLEIVGADEPAPEVKKPRRGEATRHGRGFRLGRARGSTKSILPQRPSKHHAPIRGAAERSGLPAWEMFVVLGAVALNILLWVAILSGAFEAQKKESTPLGIWIVIIAIPTILIPGVSVFGMWIRSDWGWGLALLRYGIGIFVDIWAKGAFEVYLREDLPNVFVIDAVMCGVIVGFMISVKARGAYG